MVGRKDWSNEGEPKVQRLVPCKGVEKMRDEEPKHGDLWEKSGDLWEKSGDL